MSMVLTRQASGSNAERELTRAVRRVQEQYGSDLRSFFEDVQKVTRVDQKEAGMAADSKDESGAEKS